MRPCGVLVLAAVCGLLGPTAAGAGNLTLDYAPNKAATPAPSDLRLGNGEDPRKLTLSVGRSTMVELPADAAEVFIGNPQVANAVVRTARKLFVFGIANGQTTIFALDKAGHRIATLELVINSRDLGDLAAIIKTAVPTADVRVQAVNDTIILTGFVDSAVDAQRVADIAGAYVGYTGVGGGQSNSSFSGSGGSGSSSVSFGNTQIVRGDLINSLVIREKDQVMLKVSIVEVQRSVLKQLGVNVSAGNGNLPDPSDFGHTGASSFQTPTLNPLFGQGGSSALSFITGGTTLNAKLQAFERNGVAHVLAEPTVAAISGETAKFTAGGRVPIASTSSIDDKGRCTVSTTLQDYGVKLNFTPTVLSEGRISLHMATEVSEVDGTHAAQYSCSNQVGLRVRQNETTVELPSGGSLVTAGLIQQVDKQAIAGTPGLMNLPILGALFRSRDYQREESELMIIVTPYIARTLAPNQIAKPDDGFQDASDPQAWFLGRMNRIYSRADNPDLAKTYRGRVGFIND